MKTIFLKYFSQRRRGAEAQGSARRLAVLKHKVAGAKIFSPKNGGRASPRAASTFALLLALALPVCAADFSLNFIEGDNFKRMLTPFGNNGEVLSLRIAYEHRTLATGTARMEADGLARLEITLPEMNAGVTLPATLTFSRQDGTQLKTYKAWVFSRKPVVNPKRKIYLVDDTRGHTAEMLDELSVAFETMKNTEAIATLTNALIIVGEWSNDDAIWKAALRAAEGGADVLRLAPGEEEGIITLPPVLQHFSMGSVQDILRDANAPYKWWDLEGGLLLVAHDGKVALRMAEDEKATAQAAQWKYDGGGRVRVCGMPLIVAWPRTPAARWLLAEMITTGEKP